MSKLYRRTLEREYVIHVFEDKSASLISPLLESKGYDVYLFDVPEKMQKACDEKAPDLTIVDDDFFKLLAGNTLDVNGCQSPVIKVTENSGLLDRLTSIREGCVNLLAKPVNATELFHTIENIFEKRSSEQYRCLIVDDDETTIEYHAALLEQVGINVRRLSDPASCIDVIEEFLPELILLDVEMPVINGIELSQVIRQYEKYTYIPVIFVSSETNLKRQEAAMEYGGEYFISKPVNPERFQVSISSRLKYARQTNKLHQKLDHSLLLSEQQRITLDHHAIVSIADINGEIIYVNDKFCDVSGYQREELIGQDHRLLKSGMHDNGFYDELWHTITSGNVWQGEVCNLSKNGNQYWVDSTIVPFLGVDGIPYQYVSVRTDITQLRISEERLNLSTKFSNIGTWDWNIKSGDLYWSERIAPLFGYQSGNVETTYENFLAAIHPDDRDLVTSAVNDCVESNKPYDIEHRVVWEDGTVHWLHETGNVIRDTNGNAQHMLGAVRDITESRSWQKKLSESERRMRSQLDSMGEGMFGLDEQGNTTFVNQAACAMLGYSQNELIGKSILELILRSNEVVTLKSEKNVDEIDFKCSDDSIIPVEYSSMPMLQEKSIKGTVVTFKDISERKNNERELVYAKEQAEKANMAKSQFLSSMSHELRTPLNAIMGFSQLMDMDSSSNLSDLQKDNVSEILKASHHLLELINEVLDLSKIEAGQVQMSVEPISLSEVIFDSVNLIQPMAVQYNVDLVLLSGDEEIDDISMVASELIVLGDKIRLKQIFLNLLSNAIKYNLDKGKVFVSCTVEKDGLCNISIRDTGLGISAEQLDDLFQPFNRLGHENSTVEGTGIGLVITKNLVEMMGGEISCESEIGSGTTFTVELGLLNKDLQAKEESTELAVGKTEVEQQYHVLYIEDNPASIRLMAQLFAQDDNLHLSTVHEPVMGLSIIEENKPDLVLLDINLPGMNGYTVLKSLRELFGDDYPVIALSANASPADVNKAKDAGFNNYLTKPVDIELLMASVNQLLVSSTK